MLHCTTLPIILSLKSPTTLGLRLFLFYFDKQLCTANTSWYLSDFGRTQSWNKNENCSIPAIFFNIVFIFKKNLPPLSILYVFWVASVDTESPQLWGHLLKLLCNKHFLLMPNSFILPGKCCYPFMVNTTTNIAFCFSFLSVLHISFSSSKEVILYLTALVEQKCMHLWLPVLYVYLSLLSILNLHLFQYTLYFFLKGF